MTEARPLSFNQESLWLVEQLVPGLSGYVLVGGWTLLGELDRDALERAFEAVLSRHALLRSDLAVVDGRASQLVREEIAFRLPVVELRTMPRGDQEQAVRARLRRWLDEPFDFGQAPLLRAELLRLDDRRHVLITAVHHIAWDGHSDDVFRRELSELYAAEVHDRPPELPDLPVQYFDYALWQREEVEPRLQAGLHYWAERLAGVPVLRLPTDRPRPAERRFQVANHRVDLDAGTLPRVRELAQSLGVTPFAVLLAAFDVLLARWSGQSDVAVGVPVTGRDQPELGDLLGFFVNLIVLRTGCGPAEPFVDILRRVQDALSAGFVHQDVPLQRVVERLNPPRDMSRHPLFQVTFQVVPEGRPLELTGLQVARLGEDHWGPVAGEFDLVVDVVTTDDGATVEFRYATELFEEGTIVEVGAEYARLLRDILADPTQAGGDWAESGGMVAGDVGHHTPPDPDRSPAPFPADRADDRSISDVKPHVLRLWAEELGLPSIDADADFFALGGSSLIGARLAQRLRTELDLPVSLVDLFDAATVNGLLAGPGSPAGAPLSFGQRSLWFLNRLEGPDALYNVPLALRLSGPLDRAALAAAVADLVARHRSLRTVIREIDGLPRQFVIDDPAARPAVQVHTVTIETLDAAAATAAREPFDLTTDLPFRAHLFTTEAGEHLLLLLFHHIAADGWSLPIVTRDLATAYQARHHGEPPAWPPPSLHYTDYVVQQHQHLGDPGDPHSPIARHLDYWTQTLAGLPDHLPLPHDHPRPATVSTRAEAVPFRIGPSAHRALTRLAHDQRCTLFMALHAALAALLTRLGAGEDVPIGTPVAGRTQPALDDVVGHFVNTVVLRADTSGDPSFRRLLERVREADLDAYAHQDAPFDTVVEALNPVRSLGYHPLFQVMVVFQREVAPPTLPGLGTGVHVLGTDLAKFDLLVDLTERRGRDGEPAGIDGVLDCRADLFERSTAERIAEWFTRLVDGVVADPDAPIGALNVLSPAERTRMLVEWNDTRSGVPGLTLPELLDDQATRTPDATAVVSEDSELSYGQLKARADGLVRRLRDHGVGPESVVAVALDRSLELVVALLAVVKAGAAYLPIDPHDPVERIAFLVRDAGAAAVLASAAEPACPAGVPAIAVDAVPACRPGRFIGDARPLRQDSPAYVIYTSGSTGQPKGVVVSHRAIVNRLLWMQARFGLGPDDRVLQKTPSTFDVSVWELFWPLIVGATLVVARPEGHKDPAYLAATIRTRHITTVHFVPSMLRAFVAEPAARGCTSLRRVFCSGEALSEGLQASFRDMLGVPLHNLYGPTEAAVDVTHWQCSDDDGRRPVPIGRPVWNTQVYVLDAGLRPVPTGVPGELHLAGVQLARGYLNRPGLTAERFIANPYGPPGSRLYRTGDLARWRADGNLEFLGRVDDQTKIRGFRIEPGEIEAVLARHPGVAEAAVVAQPDGSDGARLVGYVVAPALLGDDVREFTRRYLPEYMVPTVVTLPALPLTASGKLDRRALPRPDFAAGSSRRPPTNEREATLCRLFADVLGLADAGIDDNFFDLGGHSLLVGCLLNRIEAVFGVELEFRTVFESPTPAALAERLDNDTEGGAFGTLFALRASGDRTPLFCVHPAAGIGWAYAGLLGHLDANHPLYALQDRSLTDANAAASTIEEMAADYLRHIREVQPMGPYHLLGWSVGGLIAHAMAVQLVSAGERVAFLAVLDGYPGATRATAPRGPTDEDGDLPEILAALGASVGRSETLAALTRAFALNLRRAGRFSPGVFDGNLLFFEAALGKTAESPTAEAWRPHVTGNVEIHRVACRHSEMMQAGPLAEIAPALSAHLHELVDAPTGLT